MKKAIIIGLGIVVVTLLTLLYKQNKQLEITEKLAIKLLYELEESKEDQINILEELIEFRKDCFQIKNQDEKPR